MLPTDTDQSIGVFLFRLVRNLRVVVKWVRCINVIIYNIFFLFVNLKILKLYYLYQMSIKHKQ